MKIYKRENDEKKLSLTWAGALLVMLEGYTQGTSRIIRTVRHASAMRSTGNSHVRVSRFLDRELA